MAKRQRGWGWLVVAVALAVVAAGAVGVFTGRVVVAKPVEVDTSSTLSISAEAHYTYNQRAFEELPLNTTITLSFFDSDTGSPHTFTLIDWPNVSIPDYASVTTGQLGMIVQSHGTLVNATATSGLYSKTTTIAPVSFRSWYEFVCMEPGHFEQGMYGYVAFGELLPVNLSFASGSPGPGLALFIIVGTIVSLTVLAIVLGFVVGKREGSEHEMPPERLGYPEPPAAPPADPYAPPRPPLSP